MWFVVTSRFTQSEAECETAGHEPMLVCIGFTISVLCYMVVRDFTKNKFTTQMDSEGFKEELMKLS